MKILGAKGDNPQQAVAIQFKDENDKNKWKTLIKLPKVLFY